jgi:hypothetical protein
VRRTTLRGIGSEVTIPPDKMPYCTAPFTELLIDPNKDVRPCCSFDGQISERSA